MSKKINLGLDEYLKPFPYETMTKALNDHINNNIIPAIDKYKYELGYKNGFEDHALKTIAFFNGLLELNEESTIDDIIDEIKRLKSLKKDLDE